MLDNVFVQVDDFDKAQKFADDINVKRLHRQLDKIVRQYCPIVRHFVNHYHWSFMQVEYATDIIFKKKTDLKPIYDDIIRTAIHSVKPENISTFLGRKLHGGYLDEMGNNFSTRIEGTCIKHRMGKVAVKMYDKFGLVLRVETVANDVTFFKHHNRRYIEFIAAIDDPSGGIKDLNKISRSVKEDDRSYPAMDGTLHILTYGPYLTGRRSHLQGDWGWLWPGLLGIDLSYSWSGDSGSGEFVYCGYRYAWGNNLACSDDSGDYQAHSVMESDPNTIPIQSMAITLPTVPKTFVPLIAGRVNPARPMSGFRIRLCLRRCQNLNLKRSRTNK
ncbi:MAG: hypothetical protein B6I25_02535 [Planctomycetales bacterium 4572_13]|nr:MAG: hypothetical protein B6I25_02535 [Planctomycetales bacterium 4572_13]